MTAYGTVDFSLQKSNVLWLTLNGDDCLGPLGPALPNIFAVVILN